jgi:hypothetical protein
METKEKSQVEATLLGRMNNDLYFPRPTTGPINVIKKAYFATQRLGDPKNVLSYPRFQIVSMSMRRARHSGFAGSYHRLHNSVPLS